MMVNGNFVHDSEIWINDLMPERAAAIERAYQAQQREKRRRIDARFAPRTDAERRSQKYSAPPKPGRASIQAFEQRCDALIRRMERLAVRNQKRLLEFILE